MASGSESDSDEHSDTSDDQNPEMLATSRERRANAGNRMARLLENFEDNDDFYKSTYGGFFEEEDDSKFDSPVESDSDTVDSDFDNPEDGDLDENEASDAEEKIKRTRRLVTKAYKEPVHKQESKITSIKKEAVRKPLPKLTLTPQFDDIKLRASTMLRRVDAKRRLDEMEAQPKKRKRDSQRICHQTLSQEEMLEEARITENFNLDSLKKDIQLELEKKQRARFFKKRGALGGSFVRYHSTAMPVVAPAVKSENMPASDSEKLDSHLTGDGESDRIERTFITFSDEAAYKSCCPFHFAPELPTGPQLSVSTLYCVVTGLPAKYRDPLTKLPYATTEAYKTIRRAYYIHVKEKGDRSDALVARWLDRWKHVYE